MISLRRASPAGRRNAAGMEKGATIAPFSIAHRSRTLKNEQEADPMASDPQGKKWQLIHTGQFAHIGRYHINISAHHCIDLSGVIIQLSSREDF